MTTRYFKATTEDGKEYAFRASIDLPMNEEVPATQMFKLAINSKDIPIETIDELDIVEEITMREYDEINQIIPSGD